MKKWEEDEQSAATEKEIRLADECWSILKELSDDFDPIKAQAEYLANNGFTSEYLKEQQRVMFENVEPDPTTTIGLAKDLLEACCKTILEQYGQDISEVNTIPKLIGRTMDTLDIAPRKVEEGLSSAKAIRQLLGSLIQTVHSLAELRNSHGAGHGKTVLFKSLTQREARLAVSSSVAVAEYLWSTYLLRQK